MKHTPGKWSREGCLITANQVLIADARNPDISKLNSFCLNAPKWEELEANARLIASAPELLEALEETKMLHLDGYAEGTIGSRVYLKIQQAIAKLERE
ncbi:MAG: hypothetical protein M0R00_06240 [Candidatus Omnitrophica bacterium]|jgi:hypothetical protein|nr:hypothetical protein [Candidatus Omnitrophota bacterium]